MKHSIGILLIALLCIAPMLVQGQTDTSKYGPRCPVQLSSFKVLSIGDSPVLRWTTISEINNYGFYVDKSSVPNSGFVELGFVPGHGTTLSEYNYEWTDSAPSAYYRLRQVDLDGTVHCTEVVSFRTPAVGNAETGMATHMVLNQNYPNPFNPSTQISFVVGKDGFVSLRVYDVVGRLVATLVDENRRAGSYVVEFEGDRVASGSYIYTLTTDAGRRVRTMKLLK